jgi:hypothetical protein
MAIEIVYSPIKNGDSHPIVILNYQKVTIIDNNGSCSSTIMVQA